MQVMYAGEGSEKAETKEKRGVPAEAAGRRVRDEDKGQNTQRCIWAKDTQGEFYKLYLEFSYKSF